MRTRSWWSVALALAVALAAGPAHAQSVMVWGDNLPANLDPHALYDVPSSFIQLNVYDNLYRYEGNPPQLKPWLAESYTASPDGRTWEFKLKKGVTFANGDELTAEELDPFFRRVEREINVAQVPPELAGTNTHVVKRGADALGERALRHELELDLARAVEPVEVPRVGLARE